MTEPSALTVAGLRCIMIWETVNDPPCHPSDVGWAGCYLCLWDKNIADVLCEEGEGMQQHEVLCEEGEGMQQHEVMAEDSDTMPE
jgi:hypothetical protein